MACIRNGVFFTILLLLAASGWAQQQPSPGDVQRSLDRGVSPPVVREQAPETERPEPPARQAAPADGKRFRVNRFVFRGNALFDDAQLRALVRDAEGQSLTLAEIYAVADRLSDFYRQQGYSLAVVTVPAQKVSGGEVLLEVVEGRIGKVRFNGETSYSPAFLGGRLSGLEPGLPLQFGALERELLLLDDLPGLTIRSVIEPGTDYGTSDIVMNMAESRFDGGLALDNFGRENLGEWRLHGSAVVNNPSGQGDQLSAGLTHTESGLLTSGSLGYSLPLGDRGARVLLSASRADYEVAGLPLEGDSTTYRLGYSYPYLRSRKRNLAFDVAISHTNPNQSGAAALPIDDDLTLIDLAATYSATHPDRSQSVASGRITTNFSSASERPDGTLDGGQALRLELFASHERPLAPGWSLYGRVTGVYSPDELNDLQKFSLGGPSSVRAYLVTEISGDTGIDASLELRRFLLPHRKLPTVARVFVDTGWIKCRESAVCYGTDDEETLTGWGVGLTLFPFDRYTLELQWAQSIDSPTSSDGDDDNRIWVNLAARL